MREFEENAGPPSPLSGAYLLVALSEPQNQAHKDAILDKLTQGLLSWDSFRTHVDIDRELSDIAHQAPLGEDSKNGERIIQLASDALVIEILIQPTVNTFRQCLRNLLSSFTRHRHVIHAGYSLAGTGSWLLQDGTFEFAEFVECLKDPDVQRLHRVYDKDISLHVCCNPEGPWTSESLTKDPSIAAMTVAINPVGLSSAPSPGTTRFIRHMSDILPVIRIEKLLEPSDVVGNIRFSKPTLYVFPGGQGDSALFGINGFNILVDGGFARKPCFWDFTRHMDRLDAVLSTRLNTSSLLGLSSAVSRKSASPVYPQIGHFFHNLPGRADANRSTDPLVLNVIDLSQQLASQLETLQLKPQSAYRGDRKEPINLYHKVGHGTLDMFILSPSRDSKEVKEFLRLWRTGNSAALGCAQGSVKIGSKEFQIPLLDMVSISALIVWQPADPAKPVTRLLFSGSAPQSKIFEGIDQWRHLDFLKNPTCMGLHSSDSEVDLSLSKTILKKKKNRNSEERAKSTTPPRPVIGKMEVKLLKTVSAAPRPKELHGSPIKVVEKAAPILNVKKPEVKPVLQDKPKTQKPKYEVKSKINSNWNSPPKPANPEPSKPVEIPKKDRPLNGDSLVKPPKATVVHVQVNKPKVDLKGIEAKVGSFKNPANPSPPRRIQERKTPEKVVVKAPPKPEKVKKEVEKPLKLKDEAKAVKVKAGAVDLVAKVKPAAVKIAELTKSPKKKSSKNDSKSKEPEKKAAGSTQAKAVKRPVKAEAPAPAPVILAVSKPVPQPETELNFTESTAPQAASSPILNKTFDFDEQDRLHDPFSDYRVVTDSRIDSNGALDTSAEELRELASSDEDPVEENNRNALLMGRQSNLDDEEEIVIKSDSFSMEDHHGRVKEKLTLDYFGAISKSEMEGLNEARQSRDTAYEELDDGLLNSSGNHNSAGSYEEVHDLDESGSHSTEGSLKSRTLEPELELSASRLERLAKEAFDVQDPQEDEGHLAGIHLESEIPGTFQNIIGQPVEILRTPQNEIKVSVEGIGALECDPIMEDLELPGTVTVGHTEKLQVPEQKKVLQHAELDQFSEFQLGNKITGMVHDILEQTGDFQIHSGSNMTLEHGYQIELQVPAAEKNIDISAALENLQKDAPDVLVQESHLVLEHQFEMPLEFQASKLQVGENLSLQGSLTTLEHPTGLEIQLEVSETFHDFASSVSKVNFPEENSSVKEDVNLDFHDHEVHLREDDNHTLDFEVTVPGIPPKVLEVDFHDEKTHQVEEHSNNISTIDVKLHEQGFLSHLKDTATSFKNSVDNLFEVKGQISPPETFSKLEIQNDDGVPGNQVMGNMGLVVDFEGYETHAELDDVIDVVDNIYSVTNIKEFHQLDKCNSDVSLELKAEPGFFTQLEKASGDLKASLASAHAGESNTEDVVVQTYEGESGERTLDFEFKPELSLDLESEKLEFIKRRDFDHDVIMEILEDGVKGSLQLESELEQGSVPEVAKLEEVIDKLEKVAEDVKDSFQNAFQFQTEETHDTLYKTDTVLEFQAIAGTPLTLESVIEKLEKVTEDVQESFQNVSREDAEEPPMLPEYIVDMKVPKPTVRFEMDLKPAGILPFEQDIHVEEIISSNLPNTDDKSDVEEAPSPVPVNEIFGQKDAVPLCFTALGEDTERVLQNVSESLENSTDEEDEFPVPADENFEAKNAVPLCDTSPLAGQTDGVIVQNLSRLSMSSMDGDHELFVPLENNFEVRDIDPLCVTPAEESAGHFVQNLSRPLDNSTEEEDEVSTHKFDDNFRVRSFSTGEKAAEQVVQDHLSQSSESSIEDDDDSQVLPEEKFEVEDADTLCLATPSEGTRNPFAQNDNEDPFFSKTDNPHSTEKDPFSLDYHAPNPFTSTLESSLPSWAVRKEQEPFQDNFVVPGVDEQQNENTVATVSVPSFEANVITTSQDSVTVPLTGTRSIHLSQEYIVFQQPDKIHGDDDIDDVREEMFVTRTTTILESAKLNGKESDDEGLPEVHENFTAEFVKRKPAFSDDEDKPEDPPAAQLNPEKPVPSKPARVIKPRPILDSDSELEEVEETFTAVRVTRQIQFTEPQNGTQVNMEVIRDLPGTEVDPDPDSESSGSQDEQDSQEEIHFSLKKATQIHSAPAIEGSWDLPGAGLGLLEEFNHQKFVKQTTDIESRILTNYIDEPSSPISEWSAKNPFSGSGSTPVIEDNFYRHIIQSGSDTEDDEAKAEGQVTSLSSNFSSRTYDLNVQNTTSEHDIEFQDRITNEESRESDSSGPCSLQSDVSATSEVRERGVFNEHFTTSAFSSGPASWAGYEDSPEVEPSRFQLQRQDPIDTEDAASDHSFTSSISDEDQNLGADSGTILDKDRFVPPAPIESPLSWNLRSLTGIKEIDEREEPDPAEDPDPVQDLEEKKTRSAMSFLTWAQLTQENDPYENMAMDGIGDPVKDPVVFGTGGNTQRYFNPFSDEEKAVEFSRGPFEITENVTLLDDDSSTNGSDQDLFHERQVFRVTTTTTHGSVSVPGAHGIDPVIVDPFSTYSPFAEDDILRSWGKPLGLPAPIAPPLYNGVEHKSSNSSPSSTPAKNSPTGSNMKPNPKGNGPKDFAPFYVDLAFVPHHADAKYSDVEFFMRIRARHYVFSGLEPSTKVLDALIEAKEAWAGADKELDVTIIPTYDSESLGAWISTNEIRLARNRIDLAPSASRCTINLQDHKTSCSAYRLEF